MPISPDVDPDDLDGADELEGAHDGAQHGENHTRRPQRGDASKMQGMKTRNRNREIAQGKPFRR